MSIASAGTYKMTLEASFANYQVGVYSVSKPFTIEVISSGVDPCTLVTLTPSIGSE